MKIKAEKIAELPTQIEWFKNSFIPKAKDETIATLMFLYEKYCNPNNITESEKDFIEHLVLRYRQKISADILEKE